MLASYNFRLSESSAYDEEICVQAESYTEAKATAEKLLEGSDLIVGDLKRVIDHRLTINESNMTQSTNITEHHITHSGELTEVEVNGGKRK